MYVCIGWKLLNQPGRLPSPGQKAVRLAGLPVVTKRKCEGFPLKRKRKRAQSKDAEKVDPLFEVSLSVSFNSPVCVFLLWVIDTAPFGSESFFLVSVRGQ